MTKRMHPIAVDTAENGDVVLTQAIGDLNEPDPEIRIAPEQAAVVCGWIQQAAGVQWTEDAVAPSGVPATLYTDDRGPELESIEVYINAAGMVNIKVNEEVRLEISPVMAKRLREQLSRAITESLTDLLRPDAEA
jgi:hypothetical protein